MKKFHHKLLLIVCGFGYSGLTHATSERLPVPELPPNAKYSGFCCMSYDVTASGETRNVEAYLCTQEMYKKPSEESIKKRRYGIANMAGNKTAGNGFLTRVTFHILNERGNLVYDPAIYIPSGAENERPEGWSKIACKTHARVRPEGKHIP